MPGYLGPTAAPSGPGRELWQAMLEEAHHIHAQLHKRGFTFMRVLADGVIVVSAYGVLEPSDVQRAARDTAPFYPHTNTLEVFGVVSSPSGAVTKRVLLLESEVLA